ncbi:MAG: hypothetical protein L0216_02650, partial [Planctomycetales bacterium]|nr:hypothetical protein [Planctomycetales bacterium]
MTRGIREGAVLLALAPSVVAGLAASAGAQETAPPPEKDLVLGFAAPFRYAEIREGERTVARLTSPEPFRISVAGEKEPLLEAGRAVVWASAEAVRRLLGGGGAGAPGGAREAIQGSELVVYAEEDVVFRPGPGRVIRAEALLLDVAAGKASARRLDGPVPLAAQVVVEQARLRIGADANGDDQVAAVLGDVA